MNIKERLKSITYVEIFIILTIVFLTFFSIKYFGRKKEILTIRVEVIKKNWSENYDPYGYRAPFWISDKIKVGQVEKNKTGKIIATLVDLENFERGEEEAELYLTLRVEAILNKRTGVYLYKDKPLNLGSAIELSLDNIDLQGQIVDTNVPKEGYPTKYFLVKVRARNLDSWIYSKIVPGLKIYNRANNQSVAEITNVKIEDSTLQKIEYDSSGRYLRSVTGKNKDAVIDIKVKSYQMDNKWFFTGHQNLKVANFLYMYTSEFNLYGLEIEEIKEIS